VDGPAIERADGTKEWYQRDQLHRRRGPAIGTDFYWRGEKWSDDLDDLGSHHPMRTIP
jgi:hypothetical protein